MTTNVLSNISGMEIASVEYSAIYAEEWYNRVRSQYDCTTVDGRMITFEITSYSHLSEWMVWDRSNRNIIANFEVRS